MKLINFFLVLFILFSLLFISINKREVTNLIKNEYVIQQKILKEVDSIKIKYVSFIGPTSTTYTIKNNGMRIKGFHFKNRYDKSIKQKDKIYSVIVNYINQFYIDKTEKIILSKGNEPPLATDYSSILTIGYLEGEKVFRKKTILYGKKSIEFNPKFLEFYDFLNNLVKEE